MRHFEHFRTSPWGGLALLVLVLAACQSSPPGSESTAADQASTGQESRSDLVGITLDDPMTLPDVGAAQGLEWRDGRVYVYGDRNEGVLREYRLRGRALEHTGLEVVLTRDGQDTISHPTGLTWQEGQGTWLGDTVSGRGTIYHIDWEQLLASRTLDGAVLNVTADDLAVNGTRPEFVRFNDNWYLATSDYGDSGNQVRLYDPARLARASKTSEEGVLVHSFSCGPWVQSLYWDDRAGALALVQNQIEGLKWRVTLLDLEASIFAGEAQVLQTTDLAPEDELEGFHEINSQLGIFVSSSRENNLWFANLAWRR